MDAFYILTGRKLLARKGGKTMKAQSALWVEVGAEGGLEAGKSCRKRLHPEEAHIQFSLRPFRGARKLFFCIISNQSGNFPIHELPAAMYFLLIS